MRRATLYALLLASLLCAPLSTTAQENAATTNAAPIEKTVGLELIRIWPSWRSADSFLRIGEYFGGGEARSGQTILRSQPTERSGFYFLTRIKNSGQALHDAKFEIQVIRPDSPHAITYTFPATLATGSHVYLLGLTGNDWPDFGRKSAEDTHPVSWQLRLIDSQTHELLRRQSFLWTKP